jgi:hypothetical protein
VVDGVPAMGRDGSGGRTVNLVLRLLT